MYQVWWEEEREGSGKRGRSGLKDDKELVRSKSKEVQKRLYQRGWTVRK